jgi:hypothetical protein
MSKQKFQFNKAELYATPWVENPIGYVSYQAIDELLKMKKELDRTLELLALAESYLEGAEAGNLWEKYDSESYEVYQKYEGDK